MKFSVIGLGAVIACLSTSIFATVYEPSHVTEQRMHDANKNYQVKLNQRDVDNMKVDKSREREDRELERSIERQKRQHERKDSSPRREVGGVR